MNPVLLKPQSDIGAQLIVRGRMDGKLAARATTRRARRRCSRSCSRASSACTAEADLVLVEGAGSPAEINLRKGDIANMGFARGGRRAGRAGRRHRPRPRHRRAGRRPRRARPRRPGDDPGLPDQQVPRRSQPVRRRPARRSRAAPAGRTWAWCPGWRGRGGCRPRTPSCWSGARPARDGTGADRRAAAVAASPISTTSIRSRPSPRSTSRSSRPAGRCRATPTWSILPGSKATLADLAFLRAQGWDIDLLAHVRRGGRVLGVCGGYQMLGRRIADPDGVEGPARRGRRPGPAGRRDGADRRTRPCSPVAGRLVAERQRLRRLRDACRARPPARASRVRSCIFDDGRPRRRGHRRRPDRRGLCPRPVRPRPARAALLAEPRRALDADGDHADSVDAALGRDRRRAGQRLDIDALARIAGL